MGEVQASNSKRLGSSKVGRDVGSRSSVSFLHLRPYYSLLEGKQGLSVGEFDMHTLCGV